MKSSKDSQYHLIFHLISTSSVGPILFIPFSDECCEYIIIIVNNYNDRLFRYTNSYIIITNLFKVSRENSVQLIKANYTKYTNDELQSILITNNLDLEQSRCTVCSCSPKF